MGTAVACYLRVSAEEQARNDNIDVQRTFLKRYAELYQLPVYDYYEDNGVTGALPLQDRPAGARLLADARAGKFSRVIFKRVDRFSRSLVALLDAHAQLASMGVEITSTDEAFDTTTPLASSSFRCWEAWRSSTRPLCWNGPPMDALEP